MRRATVGFSALASVREPDFTALRVKATTLRSSGLAQGDLRNCLLIGLPPHGTTMLAAWSGRAMDRGNADLQSFNGFEGLHLER